MFRTAIIRHEGGRQPIYITDLETITDGTIEDCPDFSDGPRGDSGMNAFPRVPKSTLSFLLLPRLRHRA